MAFTGFPTKEALDLARVHCSREGQYYTHQQIAEEIYEEMVHPDDWRAAAAQIEGLDEDTEDPRQLDRWANIDEVIDKHHGLRPERQRRR